jgi:IclR family transcriptional regulator, KDG regulon repressor
MALPQRSVRLPTRTAGNEAPRFETVSLAIDPPSQQGIAWHVQKTAFTNAERPLTGVTHALAALEHLAAAGRELPLASLARSLHMSKPGAHRLLATLVAHGYAEHYSGGLYRLGLRAWELGRAVPELGIVSIAAPIMQDLSHHTDESSILGVLSGCETVYLHRVDAGQAVRVHTDVGSRLPAHCTSTGLALLASLPEADLGAVLPAALEAISPDSIITHEALRAELTQTRTRGYAMNVGGWRTDVAGVAAAIPDGAGQAAGALCIAVPRYRVTQSKLHALGRQVRAAAETVAASLTGSAGARRLGDAR